MQWLMKVFKRLPSNLFMNISCTLCGTFRNFINVKHDYRDYNSKIRKQPENV